MHISSLFKEMKVLNCRMPEIVSPATSNIDEYIKIVEDKAILRRLIDEATSIITESYNTSNNISEVIETAEKKIFDVSKSLRSTEFKSIQDVLYKTQADIEKLSENKGDITGITLIAIVGKRKIVNENAIDEVNKVKVEKSTV